MSGSAPPVGQTVGRYVRGMALLGIWLGLLYGFVEALEIAALSLVPGALSWRTGNNLNILWFAPLFYGLVGAAGAVVAAGPTAAARRVPWDAVLVFSYILAGAYLAGSLVGRVVADWALAVFALGVAVQGTRLYWKHRSGFGRFARRTLPFMLGAVPVLWAAVATATAVAERRAVVRLPEPSGEVPNVLVLVIVVLIVVGAVVGRWWLEEDPGEQNNLLDARPEVANRLASLLQKQRNDIAR